MHKIKQLFCVTRPLIGDLFLLRERFAPSTFASRPTSNECLKCPNLAKIKSFIFLDYCLLCHLLMFPFYLKQQ